MTSDATPAPPALPPCPGCGLTDRLVSVPAAYLAGQQQVVEQVPATDDSAARTRTRTVTSALAEALAPVPRRPPDHLPFLGALLLFATGALLIAGAVVGDWFTSAMDCPTYAVPSYGTVHVVAPPCHDPSAQWLGLLAVLALIGAVLCFVGSARRTRRWRTALAGRPEAERLWSTAWYCGRCGAVHFPGTPAAPSRPVDLPEFRRRVWTAGGYGHLAADGAGPTP
ncbi:hypothetical protein ACFW1A_14585 [Kitasatospora sp. NPDC058965]|uniref:hypothetical protein n=1 Tax=Kitasatospora sp. NPDC058965 TaxID=3346682 RepID=UPI0036A01046